MSNENKNIKIVCVSNNIETFDKAIGSNTNMTQFEIKMFDNSVENIGIPTRYNSFITQEINDKNDFWVIFCHNDFGFNENPLKRIEKLDKNNIYGVTGTKLSFSLIRLLRKFLFKKPEHYSLLKRTFIGKIKQGNNNFRFRNHGKKILFPQEVSTIDCCCVIVHSSLINKYNLRFDENLDWHMYAEEFCINSKKEHDIKTKVAQFDCFHMGIGKLNDAFYSAVEYVKKKHNLKNMQTTCIDD